MDKLTRSTFTILTLLIPAIVSAQDLVPATSEDLEMFDRQLLESARKGTAKESRKDKAGQAELKVAKDGSKDTMSTGKSGKGAKDNFGAIVSNEAKQLKEAGQDDKASFGDWVSSQRRQDKDKRPDAAGGGGDSQSASGPSASQADIKGAGRPNDPSSSGRGKKNK